MSNRLYHRDFLKEIDFTPEDLTYLLDLAAQLKQAKKVRREPKFLQDRNIVILFEKDSTRTRCSFEVAAYDQGARVTYLGPSGSQMGKKDPWPIPPACFPAFMMVLSIAVMSRRG
jgi:Ornithine carbamoyltransferase